MGRFDRRLNNGGDFWSGYDGRGAAVAEVKGGWSWRHLLHQNEDAAAVSTGDAGILQRHTKALVLSPSTDRAPHRLCVGSMV